MKHDEEVLIVNMRTVGICWIGMAETIHCRQQCIDTQVASVIQRFVRILLIVVDDVVVWIFIAIFWFVQISIQIWVSHDTRVCI